MKGFWKYVLATIVGIIILCIISTIMFSLIASSAMKRSNKGAEVKPNSVLYLNFDKTMYDKAPSDIMSILNSKSQDIQGMNTILECIEKAGRDSNIDGIFIETLTFNGGIALNEEIREALLKFKKDHPEKFIVTYSKSMTTSAYYLASVSDKIFLNPAGSITFQGLSASIMFYKNLLDKYDIEVNVFRPEGCKFKSAVEPYILDKMSDANKEQMNRYVFNIWNRMVNGISAQRNISPEKLNEIADNLLIGNAENAKQYGLIDEVAPYDVAIDYMKTLTSTESDKKLKMVNVENYKNNDVDDGKSFTKDRIAVIYAIGQISDGKGTDTQIGDQTLVKSIRKAREDKNIKAVVFRVNSPGGSALASEVILREIELLKKEKPVVASYGNYAASGGYYISCLCDKIICNPYCLTGSIGVFGMFPNFQNFLNKRIGITTDNVQTNKNAMGVNLMNELTDDTKNYWSNQVNDIYKTFIGHVSEGRNMTTTAVDSIGQGRVWTGDDAINIGLVDELGGLNRAIEVAAEMAKIDNYRITNFPKEKDMTAIFAELISNNSDDEIFLTSSQLGILFEPYNALKTLSEMDGVQARMPFEIAINY